jgi:hypothetical protein
LAIGKASIKRAASVNGNGKEVTQEQKLEEPKVLEVTAIIQEEPNIAQEEMHVVKEKISKVKKEKTEEVREVEKVTTTKKSEVISRIKSDLPIHLL